MSDVIPDDFFRIMFYDASHPMACVAENGRFVSVNTEFEKLTGYSCAELKEKTWMDITYGPDIGGDFKSVKAIIDGKISSYCMEKDYIHKRGFRVPVELMVKRYPMESHLPLLYFRVEAPPAKATRTELRNLEQQIKRMEGIIMELEDHERGTTSINIGDRIGNDKTGRDKNSDSTIKILAGVVGLMIISMIWLAYYVAAHSSGQPIAHPPSIEIKTDGHQ